ncbi:MAG: 2-oxoglutarate and iron-dependent oxygenase domain-containing protein [Hyphomicrobiaceae bacterium]
MSASTTQSIPVIDLASWDRARSLPPAEIVQKADHALRHVGFFVLTGHGVARSTIDAAFAEAARFHAQSLEAKLTVRLDRNNNGYMPAKSTTIRTSTVAENKGVDLNEAFFFRPQLSPDHPDVVAGRQYRGLNQWPENLPGFRDTCLAYATEMHTLATRMLRVLEGALQLPANWFDPAFRDCQWVTRLSHYFPAESHGNAYGLSPHTDGSFFTLLPQTEVPGLEVRLPDGQWIAPPFLPGSIVFNSGDMLHRWSNGRLLSTPHRANPPVGRDRYAIPFFHGPNWDAEIRCLETCLAPGETPRWPPITFADYMTWWYENNYASAHAKLAAETRA